MSSIGPETYMNGSVKIEELRKLMQMLINIKSDNRTNFLIHTLNKRIRLLQFLIVSKSCEWSRVFRIWLQTNNVNVILENQ